MLSSENPSPSSSCPKKFSIRDFVFKSRGKDIANHWPFSPKSLQLCLKHGKSDVLPPFQTLDYVKNTLTVVESIDENANWVVKLGDVIADSNPNKASLVETMASKICPVCKNFSSPSNTTLNAHIDRCLSCESTIKYTENSKVIKNRTKPRKTRSMADVYASSVECTLDDLDRRNGTNWALNSDFLTREDMEMCTNEGGVCFDSNGTKLRILSKFDDRGKDEYRAGKLVKMDKHSSMKKKLPECRSYMERSRSPKHGCREVNEGKRRRFMHEEDEKEESSLRLEAYDRMKSDYFGTIKPWVVSKRTVAKKNIENETITPLSKKDCPSRMPRDNMITGVKKFPGLRKTMLSLPQSKTKMSLESDSRSGNKILDSINDVEIEDGFAHEGDAFMSFQSLESRQDTQADEDPRNYFVDVDPIPIPGPPSSFLPSPGSTRCSEYEHELVNMNSLDSPVSAVTFASNSIIAARLDSIPILSDGPVLRLMGKNLKVVKQNLSPQHTGFGSLVGISSSIGYNVGQMVGNVNTRAEPFKGMHENSVN